MNTNKSPEQLAAEQIAEAIVLATPNRIDTMMTIQSLREIILKHTAPLHERIRELNTIILEKIVVSSAIEKERDSLRVKVSELEKDKERLDMLQSLVRPEFGKYENLLYFHWNEYTDLRDAIDSAITQSQSTKEGK